MPRSRRNAGNRCPNNTFKGFFTLAKLTECTLLGHALIVTFEKFTRKIMKKSLLAMLISLLANVAVAAPDPTYCGMVAAMAKSITADRDRGVAYKA